MLTPLCVCVTQRDHHHHQQRRGVVQTPGRHQVEAVHLPAAQRQIHHQALVRAPTRPERPTTSLLTFSLCPLCALSVHVLAMCAHTCKLVAFRQKSQILNQNVICLNCVDPVFIRGARGVGQAFSEVGVRPGDVCNKTSLT